MRHLILHIGLPKTGTTSIQRALASLRATLRTQGFCYPASTDGAVATMLHRVALPHGTHLPPRTNIFWAALYAEIEALPPSARTVILSSEQCSFTLRAPDQIARLHRALAPLFATTRVVIYLRRQDAHAASMYSQALRRAILESPSLAFLARELHALHDYHALLNKWAATFGADALVPRLFEREALLHGDAVADFLALCGLDPALAGKRTANPSINVEGQKLLLAAGKSMANNTHGIATSAAWRRLVLAVTRACPGRGWQPGRAEAAAFLARYAHSNEAVRRTWFPTRTALFKADLSGLPEAAPDFTMPPLPETVCTVIKALFHQDARALALPLAKPGDTFCT